uniref:SGNH hydrolase-type esterase domain-containing protein n=1 Tax=Denticeps clupeoides TaxID=299321 RepID=A0AAY4C7L9_9TELE
MAPSLIPCAVCEMYSLTNSVSSEDFTCGKCRRLVEMTERIAELEERIRNLYLIRETEVLIDSFLVPDAHQPSQPVSVSTPAPVPVAPSGQQGSWVTARRKSLKRASVATRQAPPPPGHHTPVRVQNRFSPLSEASAGSYSPPALVIGDSIVRNMRIPAPANKILCFPGARAPDIRANLKSLAKNNRRYSSIAIHVGANDVRLRQSEITKDNFIEMLELAKTMSDTVICSGPLPQFRRSDETCSRLLDINRWLSEWCPKNKVGFINNWPIFRGKPGLFGRDGIHPNWAGATQLSKKLAHSLRTKKQN